METFHQVIEIAPRSGPRYQRVITIARTDTAYTVLPSALLEMVGVIPKWHAPFAIPGHQRQNLPMAEVRKRIGKNQERTTVCVFGKSDGEPVLGTHCDIRSKGRLGHGVIGFGRPVPVINLHLSAGCASPLKLRTAAV